jgi:arsenite methyltransferase
MNYLQEIDYRTPGIGDLYDELPLWSAPFGLLLLDHVPLRRGITILDVGAGTGFLTIELAQRCGDDSQVIAVDPWEAAVTRLRRKVSHLGLTNVRTLVQDVATIDLPDASMDLIVSNLGINNFDDPEAALRACRRVAKPGADLLLTTNLVGHMAEFYETYRAVLMRVLLERTGFTFVEAITGSFRERFIDGSALLGHYFMRLGFVPGWKEIAPEGAMERTFAALEQRLNALATEQGGLALTVPLACIHARVAR